MSNYPDYSGFNCLQCFDCPYGGDCDENIRSLPNFWGYVHDGRVAFQLCPKGYCCPSSGCPSYDMCASHRLGRLCGACVNGHTKAFFSAECVSDGTCGRAWLWSAIFGSGIVCALLLVFHDDLFKFISCSAMWTHRRRTTDGFVGVRRTGVGRDRATQSETTNGDGISGGNTYEFAASNCGIEPDVDHSIEQPESRRDVSVEATVEEGVSGTALLIMFIYFYQDAGLIHVASNDNAFADDIVKPRRLPHALLVLAQFRLAVAELFDNVCMVPHMSTVHTLIARAALPVGVMFLVLLMLLCCRWRRGRRSWLRNRLSVAAALTFLFTYQRVAYVALTLLNCVAVGADSVLFVDGSVVCLQPWQYVVVLYVLGCVVPFSGVFFLAPSLLGEGTISVAQFLSACILPLPFVLYWLNIRFMRRTPEQSTHESTSDACRAVASALRDPFFTRCTAWPAVVIVRRLSLVALVALVNNPLIRMFGMLIMLILSLLALAHVRPYRSRRANFIDGVTVSALFVVTVVNMVRAGFDTAEYRPRGPNRVLMAALDGLEDALVFWLPLASVAVVVAALVLTAILLAVCKTRPLCATSLS